MSNWRKYGVRLFGLLIFVVSAFSFFFFEEKDLRPEERVPSLAKPERPGRTVVLAESLNPTKVGGELSPDLDGGKRGARTVQELDRWYRILGRVVDARGKGIAGVQLKFFRRRGQFLFIDNDRAPTKLSEDDFELINSRADGRFLFQSSARPGVVYLELSGALRYHVRAMEIEPFKDNERLLDLGDIELKDAVVIRGRVLDPEGIGVAGALINCDRRNVLRSAKAFQLKFEEHLDWGDLAARADGEFLFRPQVLSDDQGDFVIGHLESGKYELSAELKDYRLSETKTVTLFDENQAEVTLQLRRLMTLQVSVRDRQGQPIEGAAVKLADATSSSSTVFPASRTNDKGQVTYEKLAGADSTLTIGKAGFASIYETLEFSAGLWQEKSYVLSPAVTVTGTVVSSRTGQGLEALVSVILKGRAGAMTYESHSDEAGVFLLSGLGPGHYIVTVVAKGCAVQRQELVIPEGEKTVSLSPFSVEPLVAVELRVLDSEGKAVEDVRVRATELGFRQLPIIAGQMFIESGSSRALTNKEGMVTLKNVAPGTVSFSAEKEGFPTAFADGVYVAASGTKVTLRFVKAGSEIRGFCFDKSGAKKRRGQVALLRRGYKRVEGIAVVQRDGRFQFQNVSPGSYKLFSYSDDRERVFDERSGWFEVNAGVATTQDYHESN